MPVEQITPNVKKAEQGFDYSVAAVFYYFGEKEDTPPVLLVPNETISPPFVAVDEPELVLSWESVARSVPIDKHRTVEYDADGNVVAIVFKQSREVLSFDGLPLSEDILTKGRELMNAYHGDAN